MSEPGDERTPARPGRQGARGGAHESCIPQPLEPIRPPPPTPVPVSSIPEETRPLPDRRASVRSARAGRTRLLGGGGGRRRSPPWAWGVRALPLVALAGLGACDGVQSALVPAGREAERIAHLWWWMAGGAAVIWTAVVGIGVYALRVHPEEHPERTAGLLIIGGGAVFPVVVLMGLLLYGLRLLPDLLSPAPEGALRIEVSGEQWWWRVRYVLPGQGSDSAAVELANEIRLPVGERVQLVLSSPDVIHSLWIPSLAGKMDMIPGRVTRLAIEPTRTGTFRGACAEYCGTSHAFMAFPVVVMERAAFERWLAGQRAPAAEPEGALASRGRDLFLSNGCGACHTVRGLPAQGGVGPDLTHVGSRLTIGAATLETTQENLHAWIAETERIKPGVHMPAFGMLPEGEIEAIAAYLAGLE